MDGWTASEPPDAQGRYPSFLATTLTVEWGLESGDVVFDWAFPYRDWSWDWEDERVKSFDESTTVPWRVQNSDLDLSFTEYYIESIESVVQHSIEIAWAETTEAGLRFRSQSGACDGEPVFVCTNAECALAGPGVNLDHAAIVNGATGGPSALSRVPQVAAYSFYPDGPTDEPVVRAEHSRRWSRESWGPGETLIYEVASDPDWTILFGSPEGVLPYVQRAMAAWSDLPTADIRWRVQGVGAAIDETERSRRSDEDPPVEPNMVFIDSEYIGSGGVARLWYRRVPSGVWEITACDVMLMNWAASEDNRDESEGWAYGTFVHEFGHCLGLDHAAALSAIGRWSNDAFIHPGDPVMSYGSGPDPYIPTADDRVGASLLRPAPGWSQTSGNLAGYLDLAGQPVPYAHIWALPVGENPLRDRVGAFSDDEGRFLIEGLAPGEYALWVQPISIPGAHYTIMQRENVPLDLDETVFGQLVRVEAGRTSAEVRIPVRRGRTPRRRPDETSAED